MNTQAMLERQQAISQKISKITFMHKGTLSQQRVPRMRGGIKTNELRGPYPVLTWKKKGKSCGVRLKSPEEVEWAQQAIANHRRFTELCREYQEIGEQLADRMRATPEGDSMDELLKKGLKSRSNRVRKSPE